MMNIVTITKFYLVLFLVLVSTTAIVTSTPVLYVDTDLSEAGIQSESSIFLGNSFTVNVVIDSVDPTIPLNAFEFDLDYNSSILAGLDIVDGGFIQTPFIEIERNVEAPDINFAEATLIPTGSSGNGVLASIGFSAIGLGSSILDLNDLILSAPFGQPIAGVATNSGMINVISSNPDPPIPEPSTVFLTLFGLGFIILHQHRKMKIKR